MCFCTMSACRLTQYSDIFRQQNGPSRDFGVEGERGDVEGGKRGRGGLKGAPISLSRSDTVSLAIFGKCNLNTVAKRGEGGEWRG
jgi:hypothetical protein